MKAYEWKHIPTQSNTSIGPECFITIINENRVYSVHEPKS